MKEKFRRWIIKKLLKDTDGYTYTGFSENQPIKFYYDENIQEYVIGYRSGNMYYTKPTLSGWQGYMSRYLPWNETINNFNYKSEPKEVSFQEWLFGIMNTVNKLYKSAS